MASPADFPMRINKYVASRGWATRRGADDLIVAGGVLVNGKPAKIGQQVTMKDVVTMRTSGTPRTHRYYAYNKPRGIITHSPGEDETDITTSLPGELAGVFPVGRLDKDSHGLIILTDDGRVTDRLLSPQNEHEKEYLVRVKKPLRQSLPKHMAAGIDIEGYLTKPATARIRSEHSFLLTLVEGKKHQVRRMVVALGNEVTDLTRVRIMNIRLGKLKAGEARPIEGAELDTFLTELGLTRTPQ